MLGPSVNLITLVAAYLTGLSAVVASDMLGARSGAAGAGWQGRNFAAGQGYLASFRSNLFVLE